MPPYTYNPYEDTLGLGINYTPNYSLNPNPTSFGLPVQKTGFENPYGWDETIDNLSNTAEDSTSKVLSGVASVFPEAYPIALVAGTTNTAGHMLDESIKTNYANNTTNPNAVEYITNNKLFDNGLYGKTVDSINSGLQDFSTVKNNNNLENIQIEQPNYYKDLSFGQLAGEHFADYLKNPMFAYSPGKLKRDVEWLGSKLGLWDSRADKLNKLENKVFNTNTQNRETTRGINDQRQLRTNMYNIFQQGGYLPEDNGITQFNVGLTHQNNPYGGIQQGIASDGKPNYVEENEIRYKDYIYSARNKVSKSLLKKYNLPEKYADEKFAEVAEKLQKESKDRPNDPISKNTLDEMMGRLAQAQEEYNLKKEQRQLAKLINDLSPEEKAGLAQLMMQQPTEEVPQEEFNPSIEQYASGGSIHIKPSKRGTFTAAATKHGKSVQAFASQVLAHPENYSPAMVKKANFARNFGGHKHEDGGHLFQNGNYIWRTGVTFPTDNSISVPYAIPIGTTPLFDTQEDLNKFYQDEFTKYWNSIKSGRKGSSLNKGYLTGAQARNWVNSLYNSGDEKSMALANMLKQAWGDENTDWSENATWEFGNKYNPKGTIRESASYITWAGDNDKMKDALLGIQHVPQLALYMQYLNDKTPEEVKQIVEDNPYFDKSLYANPQDYKNNNTVIDNSTKPLEPIEDNLARKAGLIGSGLGILSAFATPPDFTYSNALGNLANMYKPVAPTLLGRERETDYDINLANNEAMAQLATSQRANRENTNRAKRDAVDIALFNAYAKDNAARNLAWQQAEEAADMNVHKLNYDLASKDLATIQAYDQMNTAINDRSINMLAKAAEAADNATTLASTNRSQALTNFLNNLSAYGKENLQWALVNRVIQDNVLQGGAPEVTRWGLYNLLG